MTSTGAASRFNLKQAALQDKRVRQAMCYAIDRETITKTLGRGYQTVATGRSRPRAGPTTAT
jgi:ABC-type transport system substrate-binding protein